MSSAASSAVRGRLSALSSKLSLSSPAPTADVLRGAERLLLAPSRSALRSDYASLLSAPGCDAVATGVNASVSFLSSGGLFEDMGRDNDISYYVVGRGGKGVTEDGQAYAWETQGGGHRHCVPRMMVSEGEKARFASLLMELACGELLGAAGEARGEAGDAPLLGASVHLGAAIKANTTPLGDCLDNQMRSAAAAGVDCFFVEGADADEGVEAVREAVRRNERRTVRRSRPNKTGIYVQDEEETEVGFDVPAVILREGEIHEII